MLVLPGLAFDNVSQNQRGPAIEIGLYERLQMLACATATLFFGIVNPKFVAEVL